MLIAKLILLLTSVTVGEGAQLFCFGAKWCQPCRAMQPTLDRLAEEGYPVRKVDVEQESDLAKTYQIQAVPACILVDRDGRVIDSIKQATDYATLRRMLAHYDVAPTTVRGQSNRDRKPAGIRVAAANEFAPQPTQNTLNQNPPASIPADHSFAQPSAAAAPGQPGPATDPRADALACSVRLRVEDNNGHSFGTGTVIDIHGNEALVLTCGHIFRASEGKGRILIDRFDMNTAEPTTGTVISYDIDRDVALVSMKLTRPMQIAKVGSLQNKSESGALVFSVGCDHGDPPTVMNGKVNQIDRYLGPPNITVSGRPVSGRSGGGLFNAKGELIGVCSAADPEVDEGLYGALPRVYYELDRNGLSFVYERSQQMAGANVARAEPVPANFGSRHAMQPGSARPVALNAANNQQPEELVCVLKDDAGQSRSYVIKNPSPVLLDYLEREAAKQ